MKRLIPVLGLLAAGIPLLAQNLQPDDTALLRSISQKRFSIKERGHHHNVWESLILTTNRHGHIAVHTNSYTELATGLNYRDSATGKWVPSKTEIEPLPDGSGAVARKGQHKAFFPANIYTGAIELLASDGTRIRSRPLGLSYFDGTNSVLIAELTNAVGQISPTGNKMVWTNCFTDFAADLVAEYRRGGFVCSVVFREQPPGPEVWDLPASSRLQLLTEFFDTEEPVRVAGKTNRVDGLRDNTLKFGANMTMIPGTAFALGNETNQNPRTRRDRIPVYKRWEQLPDARSTNIQRRFLIEEVPYQRVKEGFKKLSANTTSSNLFALAQRTHARADKNRKLPISRAITTSNDGVLMAKADISEAKGFVLDWESVDTGGGNYTFRGDTTYLVSGEVWFDQVTIEGGAVIKYPETPYNSIFANGFNFRTAAYRPAIFTSQNDNSVGENVDGSSGNPQPGDSVYLYCLSSLTVNHVNIRFAGVGTHDDASSEIRNSQFISCKFAVSSVAPALRNVLFANCWYAIEDIDEWGGQTKVLEHVTADNCLALIYSGALQGTLYEVKNSILRGLGTVSYGYQIIGYDQTVQLPGSAAVFQTVGAGNYYLADQTYRNVGTVNISAAMQKELKTKTTYPPALAPASLQTTATWSPTAQRDTDARDLGYHYDPLDYLCAGMDMGDLGNLILTNGVAVGFSGSAGFDFAGSPHVTSEGRPDALNRLVWYPSVQEQPVKLGGVNTANSSLFYILAGGPDSRPVISMRFTEVAMHGKKQSFIACGDPYFYKARINLSDNEFKAVSLSVPAGVYGVVNPSYDQRAWIIALTNNLFWESAVSVFSGYNGSYENPNDVALFNNLFVQNGSLSLTYNDSGATYHPAWKAKDNLFDGATIAFAGNGNYLTLVDRSHNAFFNPPPPTSGQLGGTANVLLTELSYGSGLLGQWYVSSSTPNQANQGSQSAAAAGLYHYTITPDSAKEGNSQVDIGFHHVGGIPAGSTTTEAVWVEDSIPTGGYPMSDYESWTWMGTVLPPYSGALAHHSSPVVGMHQHYFFDSPQTLDLPAGSTLFAYVYLDPANPPAEVMLQWHDTSGSWEHRAYWGADQLPWGVNNTASRRPQGDLPAAGQWVRLEVPVADVGLTGLTIDGMAYSLYNGKATWDRSGKVSATVETVWVEDNIPAGSTLMSDYETWTWMGNGPSPYSGALSHPSALVADWHQHYFAGATPPVELPSGSSLFTYLYLDPANLPAEVMLQWHDTSGSWEHRAYWGADQLPWGENNTASRRRQGDLPPTGQWFPLEVPVSEVGLTGQTIDGMAYSLYGGKATWDKSGMTHTTIQYSLDSDNDGWADYLEDRNGNGQNDSSEASFANPAITLSATPLNYTENQLAQVLDGTATVSDEDSANFKGGRLTVEISVNADENDKLAINHQGTAAGQIGISGNNVTFGLTTGVVTIGKFEGGSTISPLVINFSTVSATHEAVQALVRNLTFKNSSDHPGTAPRTVSMILTDGDGGTSAPATKTVNVSSPNDIPVITLSASEPIYSASGPAIPVDESASVFDADSLNFDTGTLTVSLLDTECAPGADANDRLEIKAGGSGSRAIGVFTETGTLTKKATYGGVAIGTITGGSGTTPLVITFNAQATLAAVDALVRAVAYRSISADPPRYPRTVRFQVTDGDTGTSTTKDKTVTYNCSGGALDVVVVIDRSSSMGDHDAADCNHPDDGTALYKAKQAAVLFVQALQMSGESATPDRQGRRI